MSDRETTADLMVRLQRHYIKPGEPMPGGVFIEECGLNGNHQQSRCDALYAGFTSTSGRLLIGHEVKASRADWRKELDSPGKSDKWADQCHAWYIVAPSVEIVPPQELPSGWGLMVPGKSKTRMTVVVKAMVHADRTPSWEIMRSILARYDTLRASAIRSAANDARDVAHREMEAKLSERLEHAKIEPMTYEHRTRLGVLERFERAIGMELSMYGDLGADGVLHVQPEHLAAALAVVRKTGRLNWPRFQTDHLRRVIEVLDDANRTIDEFKAQATPTTGETHEQF